ncbi:MAG TPA: GAF domain-containing protein, partial [Dehalococcoidia bacterium]|nr:GAF domain-containing protein [Dehalococcoidia bacterium]
MTALDLPQHQPAAAEAAQRSADALALLHTIARLRDAREAGRQLGAFLRCAVYEVAGTAELAHTPGAAVLAALARAGAASGASRRSPDGEQPAWAAVPLGRGRGQGAALVVQRSAPAFSDDETALLETAAALWPSREPPAVAAIWDSAEVAALADSIQDAIALLDAEGNLRLANAAYRRVLADAGIDSGPLSSAPEKVMPRDERGRPAPTNEAISRALAGRDIQFKRTLRMADGSDRSFSIVGVPVRSPDGAPIGVCVVLHEETERRQRERELRLLDEIRRGLSLAGDLRHAARVLCRRVNTLLPWADMAAVFMLDGDEFVLLSQASFPARAARMLAPSAAGKPERLLTALQTNRPTIFAAETDEPSSEWSRRLVVASGAATFVNLPLSGGTQAFGVLTLGARRPHVPSQVEMTLLEALAAQAGAELERARQREGSEAERASLRAVLDQLPEGVLLFDAAGRLVM